MGGNNTERARKALETMKQLGIPRKQATPVLKELLNTYNYNWEPIENDGYIALIDAFFTRQDDRETSPSQQGTQSAHADSEPDGSSRDNRQQYVSACHDDTGEDDNETPLVKRPRMGTANFRPERQLFEPGLQQSTQCPLPTSPQASRRQTRSLTVVPHAAGNEYPLGVNDALVVKEPKPEPQIGIPEVSVGGPMHRDFLACPDDIRLNDGPSGSGARGSVANQAQSLGRSPQPVPVCKNGVGSTVQNTQETSFVKVDVASSANGEVKMSLKCSLDSSNLSISMEEVFEMVEQKCLHSYKVLPPDFSIGKLMSEVCQSVVQLGTMHSEVSLHNDVVAPLHTRPLPYLCPPVAVAMASASASTSDSSNLIVLGCGAVSVDYLAMVASFPNPDDKIRSLALKVQGGGNTGNALTAAARLGLRPRIISKVANDAQGRNVLKELQEDGIDTSYMLVAEDGNSPFTYIIVDNQTKTRTCIHTPGYPPLSPEELTKETLSAALDGADMVYFDVWLHETALIVAQEASQRKIPILIDAEKKREGLDELLNFASYVVCSTKFPLAWTGASSIPVALVSMLSRLPKIKFVIVTLGDKGCLMLERSTIDASEADKIDIKALLESLEKKVDRSSTTPNCVTSKANLRISADGVGTISGRLLIGTAEVIPPDELIDTTGAGDAFIGAVLYGLCTGMAPERMLPFASQVAAAVAEVWGLGAAFLIAQTNVWWAIDQSKFRVATERNYFISRLTTVCQVVTIVGRYKFVAEP